jgi:23S rRNA pseudouridine1911/1915/1917 synthase
LATRGPSISKPAKPLATGDPAGEFRSHVLTLSTAEAGRRLDQPRARDTVRGGEEVRITASLPLDPAPAAEALPLEVVYADRALLVVNKPAGLIVHPGAGHPRHTLLNALLAYDEQLRRVPRAGIVHRLDKDTSGLLLIARTVEAHHALVAALAARRIARQYLAVCTGVMTGGGTVDQPIGRHRRERTRMAVRSDGRPAATHYRIARRFRAHTLLRATLESGRTHQIRVHLAHIGYPLVGDPVYGGRRRIPAGCTPELRAALDGFRRQALHAARLELTHPSSGRELAWEVPPPTDFSELISALERDLRAGRGG